MMDSISSKFSASIVSLLEKIWRNYITVYTPSRVKKGQKKVIIGIRILDNAN